MNIVLAVSIGISIWFICLKFVNEDYFLVIRYYVIFFFGFASRSDFEKESGHADCIIFFGGIGKCHIDNLQNRQPYDLYVSVDCHWFHSMEYS